MAHLTPHKIIIRMPNWIGDLVMATPLLSDIKEHFPDCHLTALVQSNVAPLLEKDPRLDALIYLDRPKNRFERRSEKKRVIEEIRQGSFDLGILTTNSLSSAWLFFRGKVKERIGFKAFLRRFLLSKALPFPLNREEQHLVATYKELLRPLGLPLSNTLPALHCQQEQINQALQRLSDLKVSKSQPIIAINPGAAYGSAKCWLPERYRTLTKALLKEGRQIIYLGDPKGASLVDTICRGLPVVNLAGKTTLEELTAILSQVDVLVTNDSGPMHIASALGIKTVALFGSTSAIKTGPYQKGLVIHKHVPCSPCYQRECPLDFACMKQIEVQEVLSAIHKALSP
ncbi:MAG: hypothetical protein K0S07_1414 [Chlamydiales bacterium]|jgi:heptosyltransferase-2|nr:hypothetical protein [Chlamydiales bacterium]